MKINSIIFLHIITLLNSLKINIIHEDFINIKIGNPPTSLKLLIDPTAPFSYIFSELSFCHNIVLSYLISLSILVLITFLFRCYVYLGLSFHNFSLFLKLSLFRYFSDSILLVFSHIFSVFLPLIFQTFIIF